MVNYFITNYFKSEFSMKEFLNCIQIMNDH